VTGTEIAKDRTMAQSGKAQRSPTGRTWTPTRRCPGTEETITTSHSIVSAGVGAGAAGVDPVAARTFGGTPGH
jgi:hypothetical protein